MHPSQVQDVWLSILYMLSVLSESITIPQYSSRNTGTHSEVVTMSSEYDGSL